MSNIEAIKDAAMRYANCRVDVVRGTEDPNEAKALLDEFYSELRNLEAYVSELEAAQEELAAIRALEPFGYFCDWGNDTFGLQRIAMYYDGPGSATEDDWNEYPSAHQNLKLYALPEQKK